MPRLTIRALVPLTGSDIGDDEPCRVSQTSMSFCYIEIASWRGIHFCDIYTQTLCLIFNRFVFHLFVLIFSPSRNFVIYSGNKLSAIITILLQISFRRSWRSNVFDLTSSFNIPNFSKFDLEQGKQGKVSKTYFFLHDLASRVRGKGRFNTNDSIGRFIRAMMR